MTKLLLTTFEKNVLTLTGYKILRNKIIPQNMEKVDLQFVLHRLHYLLDKMNAQTLFLQQEHQRAIQSFPALSS